MSYDWITENDFVKWELRTSYLKYKKSRKYSDQKWFEYWLDYLQLKNRYNEKNKLR